MVTVKFDNVPPHTTVEFPFVVVALGFVCATSEK
jgi:hypothetical protein